MHFVTTADERTWKGDRPIILLGDWCRRYERRTAWINLNAIAAKPYGLGQDKKYANYKLARAIEGNFFGGSANY
jgi:hypothetical protein